MSYKFKPTNYRRLLLYFGTSFTIVAVLVISLSFRNPYLERTHQTPRNQAAQKPAAPGPLSLSGADAITARQIAGKFWQLPLAFEENHGQVDSQVRFISRGNGYTLLLTSTEAVMTLRGAERKPDGNGLRAIDRALPADLSPNSDTVLRIKMIGSNSEPTASALDELPGKVHYLLGNDSKKWRTNIPTFAKVRYPNVYPGVDLVYYGNQRQLEYDFIVAPGADPDAIKIAFAFDGGMELTSEGGLIFRSADAEIRQGKPTVYQDLYGIRHEIPARYVLKGKQEIGFELESYDSTSPLIIDPVLLYSTYLGGSGYEFGYDIAVDPLGNAYVAGQVNSLSFPLSNPLNANFAGGDYDGFVSKLNASGSAFEYSTYLGGSNRDFCEGIAVDSSGSAYVTGITQSANFPVTTGSVQTEFGGGTCGSEICYDAFVVKLDETGSGLVFSTFLGGTGFDDGRSIKVDAAGYSYLTGIASPGYPTTSGAYATTGSGGFVTKLNQLGSELVYSTILRGANLCQSIALDASGNAHVTGRTFDPNFPRTPGAFQTIPGGSGDAFVTKFNATGSLVIYSTLLGGSGLDSGFGIAVDGEGNAYVTGETQLHINEPPAFPTTPGSLQVSFGGGHGDLDGFVTKLNPAGSAVVYSTLLGGNAPDRGTRIAVDNEGNAFVVGWTSSSNFHLFNAFQADLRGSLDAFLAKINPTGSGLIYSSYLGGSGGDQGEGLALDPSGNAYVMGATDSVDFPTINPAQQTYSGGTDTFIAKIGSPPGETPVGSNVIVQSGAVTLIFDSVSAAGITSVTGIDPSTVGDVPGGFSVSETLAYQITSTAAFSGPVTIAFLVPSPISESDFNLLSIFHNENGVLVDVTATEPTRDYSTLHVYAVTNSFSRFYIVRKGNHVLPFFDQTKAYKAGRTIPIKVQLLNSSNTNISSSSIALEARSIIQIGGNTSSPVVDSGNANPDYNFRYDPTLGGAGGGYIFNLSTMGLRSGTYILGIYAGSDHSFFYTVRFEVK